MLRVEPLLAYSNVDEATRQYVTLSTQDQLNTRIPRMATIEFSEIVYSLTTASEAKGI